MDFVIGAFLAAALLYPTVVKTGTNLFADAKWKNRTDSDRADIHAWTTGRVGRFPQRPLPNRRLKGNTAVSVNTKYQHLSDLLYIDMTMLDMTPWDHDPPFPLAGRLGGLEISAVSPDRRRRADASKRASPR